MHMSVLEPMALLRSYHPFIVFPVHFGGFLSPQQQQGMVVSGSYIQLLLAIIGSSYAYVSFYGKFFLPIDAYPTSACGKIVAVFALLCGVLVIAFPVSIFSELWSNELHALHEMKNQFDEINDDDYADGLSYQSSEDQQAPVKFVSTTSTNNFEYPQNGLKQLDTSMSFRSMVRDETLSTDSVIKTGINQRHSGNNDLSDHDSVASEHKFTAKDVAELRQYVETIENSQQQIRKILAKLDQSK